jgi:hypothetical protein
MKFSSKDYQHRQKDKEKTYSLDEYTTTSREEELFSPDSKKVSNSLKSLKCANKKRNKAAISIVPMILGI